MRRFGLVVVAGVAVVLLASTAVGADKPRRFPTSFPGGCARADFQSRGRTVRAEQCDAGPGSPAAVVLYGCGGFSAFAQRLAVDLAEQGITTLEVDYFWLTPPPRNRGFCNEPAAFGRAFPVWIRVVDDAARSLRLDHSRVGVVGWSLGGGVALAAAESKPANGRRPFDAVAAFSTGDLGGFPAALRLLPPTLLLSGGPHDAIPARDTRSLFDVLRKDGVVSQLYVYGDGTHQWPGAQGTAGIRRASAFLRRYLR